MIPDPTIAKTPRRKSRLWRWSKRFFLIISALAALYAIAAQTLSRTPVNRDFVETEDGIEVAIISNGVHVDLALPLTNEHYDWMRHFRKEDVVQFDPHVRFAIFGWGERTFYLETPTWWDVKPGNVLRAFCGAGRSVMHVDFASWKPVEGDSCRLVKLSPQQYQNLCREIRSSLKLDDRDRALCIANAHYHSCDAFYEATGHYHLFHTCNVWAGDALRSSGVRMGVWTPTTGGVFACLPDCNP